MYMKTLFKMILCLAWVANLSSQGLMYRPNASSPILLNPAYSGKASVRSHNFTRFIFGGQYNKFLGESIDYITYDQYHDKLGGGLGVIADRYHFTNDVISSWSVKGTYNYLLPVTQKLRANIALIGGIESRSLRADQLHGIPKVNIGFLDPSLADSSVLTRQVNKTQTYGTFGFGILLQGEKYELGFSALDVNRPDWNVITGISSKKPMTMNVHGLVVIKSFGDNKARIYLKGLYTKVGTDNMLYAGLQFKSEKLMFGLAYNNYYNDSISLGFMMASAGYNFDDDISIRYNLEYQVSKAWVPMVNHTFSLIWFWSRHYKNIRPMGQPYIDLTF